MFSTACAGVPFSLDLAKRFTVIWLTPTAAATARWLHNTTATRITTSRLYHKISLYSNDLSEITVDWTAFLHHDSEQRSGLSRCRNRNRRGVRQWVIKILT